MGEGDQEVQISSHKINKALVCPRTTFTMGIFHSVAFSASFLLVHSFIHIVIIAFILLL